MEDENIQRTEAVLDLGCGTGQTAAYLAERFHCQLTAIDKHPIMVEKAKERLKNNNPPIQLIEGDAENLRFADDSFDLVIAESVIAFTHISKTLDELARVIKNTGRMIIIEMTAEQNPTEALQREIFSLYGIREVLTEEEWRAKLQQAGFTKIETIKTPSALIPSELHDVNQSKNIHSKFFDLWEKHDQFVLQNNHFIGFRVFKCHLS
ncbi:class I SAM-dependent methyltransferase [Psychrobacillus sp. OK032]|uniref:class I SAM-dependent methyltransferase n=1 Tax=Psychrobacillus sp. OK032 TaxID=1884358 RepID=UPI0008B027E2|nr:class I SAM-dependent methyltransferase [Psychrobacillus sp. OK032]SES19004.1 Methyltransferase domain-containing protein [Psychrobacillus sp. OK032]